MQNARKFKFSAGRSDETAISEHIKAQGCFTDFAMKQIGGYLPLPARNEHA